METWKTFFEKSGADLWTICERALTLAYVADPHTFPLRRDTLAQKLFAPEKLDLQASEQDAPLLTKFDASTVEKSDLQKGDDWLAVVNGTYDEAEVLTEEMEEEILVKRSVLSIKEILQDPFQSEKEILDSLQRLDFMQLSVDVLQDTEIGKIVNNLRKNPSKRVSSIAKQLVRGWKDIVNEWVKCVQDVSAAATSETPASASPDDINEEHGLPSPPMDEGALLATHTGCVEISQLFDFMDYDTSAGSDGLNCLDDNRLQSASANHKNPSNALHNVPEKLHSVHKQSRCQENSAARDNGTRKDQDKEASKEWRAGSNINGYLENAVGHSNENYWNGGTHTSVHERSLIGTRVKSQCSSHNQSIHTLKAGTIPQCIDDTDYDEKVEATKRKLQKNYQQAENAKKQRTIRVMDLQDLPKGGPNRARPSYKAHSRPGSQNRSWLTGHK